MADGYISQIKTPDNKVYLLKDSEKTDEKVKQTSNTEDKEFPIILKNTNNTTNETAGVKYVGGVTVNPSEKTITADEFIGKVRIDRLKPIVMKTYTAPLYNATSGANFFQTFATVSPADYNAIWIVSYRITITASGHSDYTAIYDVSISGRANTCYTYKVYNSLVNYPIYQHAYLRSNAAATPHELGYRMQGSYGADTVSKVIKVELLEQNNCTVTLLDSLKTYANTTPSGYAGWTQITATSNGLQETGDANDYGYYILSNGFKGKAGSNKVYRYCLFARTGDGTYESFVMQDNTVATTKTANPHGFVPDGKIYWNPNNTVYNEGTFNISPYEQYHVVDYRYSFNFNNTFLPDYCETYVVYTYNEDDGLLYLDTTQWLATALPTTADGKIYQRIGSKYYTGTSNYYQGSLLLDNPYYEYKNGKIKTWAPSTRGIKNITRSGTTFTVTRDDGSTFTFDQRDNNTTYSAGTGLSLSNTTFNHSNSVTAKTAYVDTATTASANGGTIKVTDIKYDAQGHITGSQDRTITLSQVTSYLPLAGGVMTGNIRRYYSAASTEPMITALSNNQDIYLWQVGHGTAAATNLGNNGYKLLYKGTNSSTNNYLQLIATKADGTETPTFQVDEIGNLTIGSTSTASATRTLYGTFDFKSANGFTYSGMATGSDNAARPVWFSYNGITGRPVYDNDFKYNPGTNTLTIGTGTITATNYSGKAATAGTADSANAVAWSNVSGKPSTFAPSAHDHNRLNGIGRLRTVEEIAFNTTISVGNRLSWCLFDSQSRANDATNSPSFDASTLNMPWDWGAYMTQIAFQNAGTRIQIRSATHTDNGEGANPRYTPNYGAWREVVTATKATKVGDTNKPVYINATGQATAISYEINKSVPSNAVFTDHYAWGDITSKPDTATRWPKWNEISQSGAESLNEGSSDVTDNTEILTSYASNNGFADTNGKGIVYRRDAIHIYNYINGKLGTMAHETASNYAKLASPALTGTPTAPTAANGTSTTQIATTAFVNNTLSYVNAMRFKGTLGTGGTITALPASHEAGDTYRVITAGTWAGKYCEVGTLIICTTDGTAAADADWTSVETNEDGAVIGPSSSTDNAIARFDGATGRIIQDSKVTVDDNGNLVISHAASATMTVDSTNPKITFSESGSQPVHLIYTDYDSYRAPAGLKIIGGSGATPAWLEVEGNTWSSGFKITGKTTSLTDNNLTFSQGGGWSMSDSTWIRTVGSKSVYMNTGTFRNDGTTQLRTLQHVNANIVVDGDWVTGATGTAPTATTTDGTTTYSGATIGTSILTLGNNKVGANSASGVANNSQGYLRLYSSGSAYGELTGYTTSANTHIHANTGISLPENKIGIMFRPGSGSYYTYFSYQTAGNEALVAATQNSVTSFIFVNGESYANAATSNRWQSLTPGLQIKQNCVSIGELIPSGTNATYKLNVNGTSNFKNTMYSNSSLYMTKAGEVGLEVDNTQATNPNKVAFIVGSSGNGGIYSRKHSKWIVYSDASGNVVLNGNANTASTASALSNFKVTTTSNLGIDAPGTNAIGYVSGLTKAAWNYQQTDGALYTQFYNANWIGEIFQDYRTGQISVRGKNNGTWQSWRRVLDETNGATILGLGAGTNNAATLTWGTTYTIAKINGTDIKFTTMAKPSYSWSDISSKPITFITGAYGTTGWSQLGGRASSQSSIVVSKPTDTVTWGTIAHAAAIAFGNGDTKGMIDISYNTPIVSIAGGNASGSTDAAPKWYFKLSATSGQTYTFPTTSKTLAASDGSNASGSWGISITGKAGSVDWANTGHPSTFPPSSHTHGNITNDGKITTSVTLAANDYIIMGDSSDGGKLVKGPIFDGSTATKALTQKGTWETFNNYSHPTGDGNLHVPATGTTNNGKVLKAGSTAGSISWGTLSASDVGAAASSHSHGNISSSGTIGQTSNWALASGDGLVVFDSSNSNKLERTGITFDGSTTTQALTKKGTWETFNNYSHPTGDGNSHVPATSTTNGGKFLKAGSTANSAAWANIVYPDIKPTTSKTYAPANSYGTSDAEATCCFFFMSVKPDSWYKGWQVRFKVRTVADSYANVDSTTWCTLNGRADSFIYHNWNERYDIGHYYVVARSLKSAGFNAGLGHMVGVNVRYSTGRGNTNYTRKIYLDYYDCEGCTVTILDAANLWANLGNTTNYSDTNYNGYTNLDAVNRGLRESGDDNTTSISHLYEQYGGWVAENALYRYQFVFENADHKFVSIFGTDNAPGTTNKTLLTVDFDPNGRIFYHNTTGTTAANANIDSGRLYYAVLADLRYSFNVTSTASSTTFTGTRYTSLYLKTQMTASTGMVHVASNQPLVTTLPTSNDGYYYIYLGQVHDWYRVMMTGEHPVYYHDGNKIVEYMGNNIGANKYIVNEKVTLQWNSTDSSLDFIFA